MMTMMKILISRVLLLKKAPGLRKTAVHSLFSKTRRNSNTTKIMV